MSAVRNCGCDGIDDSDASKYIFNDHCAGDGIPFELFCRFCNHVWQDDKHNFVTIDLTKPVELGKYRNGLNDFWINSLST